MSRVAVAQPTIEDDVELNPNDWISYDIDWEPLVKDKDIYIPLDNKQRVGYG